MEMKTVTRYVICDSCDEEAAVWDDRFVECSYCGHSFDGGERSYDKPS